MQRSLDVDLAVIGAGPAGAACALRALQHDLTVAVFEPQGDVFDKPCGEGLMPIGVRALAEIGVHPTAEVARAFDTLRYRVGGTITFEVGLTTPGLTIMRPDLLAALVQPLHGYGERILRVRKRAAVELSESGYLVRTPGGSDLLARTLVIAEGLGGNTAPWLRRPSTGRPRASLAGTCTRVGVRARFRAIQPLEHVEIHLAPDCEIYLTPLVGDAVNVALLLDRKPATEHSGAALIRWALERHPHARARLGELTTAPTARAIHCSRPQCVARAASFLAGDAAGGVDPVLGCGVSLALWSGVRAADCARAIVRGAAPEEVARAYRAQWRKAWLMRHRLARLLRTLGRRPIVAATLFAVARSSRIVREGLVRIAAG